MFSTRLYTLVFLAVGIAAVPAPLKRTDATPTLAARAPQFSVNIPNNIPVSGAFPNGITITPQTPSGSTVTGNNNSTLLGALGFKRDDLESRQFNFTLPNQLPVEGILPFGLSVTQGAQNSTVGLPSGFPFKRGLEARQFNFTLPNQLPVEGALPFGLTVAHGAQNSTVSLPAGFPFNFKREGATPALAAREPQFSANIPNTIPVSGTFPNGITITPGTPSGSIVTGNDNSTLFGSLPFKRDVDARQLNFTLPNRLPGEGVLPFGLSVTQGAENSTVGLPAGFPFKRDDSVEARQFNFTLPNQLPVEGVLPFGLSVTKGAQNSTVGLPANFPF